MCRTDSALKGGALYDLMRLASCFSIIFLSVANSTNRKQLLPGFAFGRLAVWLNGEWRPRGAHSAVSRGAAGSPGHHAVVRSSDHVYADAPLHAVPRFAIASSVPAGSGPYHDTSQEWISYASTNRYIFFENRWIRRTMSATESNPALAGAADAPIPTCSSKFNWIEYLFRERLFGLYFALP